MKKTFITIFVFVTALLIIVPLHSKTGKVPRYSQESAETVPSNPVFAEVDKLKSEQKFQEALVKAQEMFAEAKRKKDYQLITESLIRATDLMVGLGQVEAAVVFFKSTTKSNLAAHSVLLDIYYGNLLGAYYTAYSWEIQNREKTATMDKDIKTWTATQISSEILRAYSSALQSEDLLQKKLPEFYKYYVAKNTYPQDVRPTVRDFVVYSAANHLANSSFWTARESNETSGLPLSAMLKGAASLSLTDSQHHPLVRMASLLLNHKAFHAKHDRWGAALEAQYTLYEKLLQHLEQKQDRRIVMKALLELQTADRSKKHQWWATGQALLAQQLMVDAENEDRFVHALEAINLAIKLYPESYGARKGISQKSEILRPQFTMVSMSHDGESKQSLQINYKNVPRLHFRAYAMDLKKEVQTAPAGELWGHHILEKWRKQSFGEPVASWIEDLPPTKDYVEHVAYAKPQLKKHGAYLIMSSVHASFADQPGNQIQAVPFVLTGIVLQRWNLDSGNVELRAVSGETGQPISGVTVSNWARNEKNSWSAPAVNRGAQTSDASGLVQFVRIPKIYEYFQIAEKGEDVAYMGSSWSSDKMQTGLRRIIVMTDRSIFRPQQKIYWKVLDFHGDSEKGNLVVSAKQKLVVELYDANRKVVAAKNVTTNEYGSASGEFVAEKGKALGAWQIIVRRGNETYAGSASVRVEEYKRPTFEVELKQPTTTLRLNKKATVLGEARYYFGQSVTNGNVKWRVERVAFGPWWWRGSRQFKNETIATGKAKVAPDGTFKMDFTAKADEREKESVGLQYHFTLHADVTDEGGETRSGVKEFHLGFVTIDANIAAKANYFKSESPIEFAVTLSDLDGQGKAGNGKWQIVKVAQPEKPLLPVDLPLANARSSAKKYALPGDGQRPRWDTRYEAADILSKWPSGASVSEGNLNHDPKGLATLKVDKGLSEGLYRLIYKSKDEFGGELSIAKEFFVVGSGFKTAMPLLAMSDKSTYEVGDTAKFIVASGFKDQSLFVEVYSNRRRKKKIEAQDFQIIEIPITEQERGGFTLAVSSVRDYQVLRAEQSVAVPWTSKQLNIHTTTFRDKVRPGSKETIRLTIKDSAFRAVGAKAAEVLAFMYDRSLDFFAPHSVESALSSYPQRAGLPQLDESVSANFATSYVHNVDYVSAPPLPREDTIVSLHGYAIGGPGHRGKMEYAMQSLAPMADSVSSRQGPAVAKTAALEAKSEMEINEKRVQKEVKKDLDIAQPSVRSDFSETAFWRPHLRTDASGNVSIEYTVPDALTAWNFWAAAITTDVRSAVYNGKAQSVKELMVRPYLPRFLREGDEAQIKVMVNSSSSSVMSGDLEIFIEDAESGKSALPAFGLGAKESKHKFSVNPNGSTTVSFMVRAPKLVRPFNFTVRATANEYSDGEKRVLPVLPSRVHLAQSRFVTLRNKDQKTMEFSELAKGDDPTLISDRLVLNVDAQLFYGVLQSLPYLISYPYECAEQTLNRFLSTGIIHQVYKKYPSVQKMALEMSKRKTVLETFDGVDANHRMMFEESPWLQDAKGGAQLDTDMTNVLDSREVIAEKDRALKKLRKMQTAEGAFPWFDGGRPDEYITLYMLMGFSRAQEFHVEVPKDIIVKAWKYMKSWNNSFLKKCIASQGCAELTTLLNFALTSYPDDSWTGGVFSAEDRKLFLEHSFKSWKTHSPLLKGYLALTLKRMNRYQDAQLVWASVMDSAKSTDELGTYWAPEERSWLWYNDSIETHAFALRVQMEMAPADKKNDGLVQWLFLNKKMNHWKSTRATAESIYSLVHYLEKEKSLGVKEEIVAKIGGQSHIFRFDPEKYTGKKNQVVLSSEQIRPERDAKITVSKSTPGFAFASSTWHFSTEKIPMKGDGDMFNVSRKYFIREMKGKEWTLKPFLAGSAVQIGDQIEVQISLRAKHAAEYVHLRDPRGAGFEPDEQISQYRSDLGLYYYQEVRDSGGNFFFDRLPVGQYTFKHRLRATMSGTFRVGPATVQSLYAPEFNAYSNGDIVTVKN